MKQYRVPAIVLVAASLLLALLTLKSVERARRAAADLAEARRLLGNSRRDLMVAQAAAARAKKSSAPVEEFLAQWNDELAAEASIEPIFGKLDTLAVNDVLSPSGKNFGVKPGYLFQGRKMPVQNVNITVAGEFYRTLNWLGAVEYAFPLARVEQISYAANGGSLTLALQLVFPRKFETE